MPVSAPWQFNFNGLDFGGATGIQLLQADGLMGLGQVRSGDVARPRSQGMLAGLDLLGARTITLKLQLFGTGSGNLNTTVMAANAAFSPQQSTPLPFSFQLPGQTVRQAYCRCRKRDISVDTNYAAANYAIMTVQLDTVDPRIYESQQSLSTVLPTPPPGVGFPRTFPVTWGAAVAGGYVICANAGSYATPLTIRVTGPVIQPRLQNTTLAQQMNLNITLSPTDVLMIDCDAHTITLNNTASRRDTFIPGSTWLTFPPGANQFNFYSSDPAPTAATMTILWANAWI